tara:strand:- start:25 stop:423 length:399 start_codon:yes stop_codon:yes gene_type:complete
MTEKRQKAGGFRVPSRTARLVFTDELYAGAEVVVSLSVPLGVAMDMRNRNTDEDPASVYTMFVTHGLESWNLENEEGGAIPVTVDGLESLPTDFVLLMISEWVAKIGEVPSPLSEISNDGSLSLAELTPTGT